MRAFLVLSLLFSLSAEAGQISVGKMHGTIPAFRSPEPVSSVKTEVIAGEPHLVVYGKSKAFPSCFLSYELLRKNGIDRVAFLRTLTETNAVVVQCAADEAGFASEIFLETL